MRSFRNISFKNKMLFSTLPVILLLGVGVFLAIRWVLIPNLMSQLRLRGLGIAQSIAEGSRTYILTENIPELTSLIFDTARLAERRPLIAYLFILDKQHNVLSHTFIVPFPEELGKANRILPGQSHSIKHVRVHGESAYDIAVPILEGIYQVGTVHVGLNKRHIDHLIGKLAAIFLGILSAIIVIGLLISHFQSKYITRPISELTRASDEISRGNLDITPNIGSKNRCWEIKNCEKTDCPAYHHNELPCYYLDETMCSGESMERFPDKLEYCKGCAVYSKRDGDEITQLADSFSNMACRLRASKSELKKSEEEYRFIFDYGPNSKFVLDPETFIISDANVRAMEIYGYKKEELTGKSFMDLGPSQYDEGVLSGKEENTPALLSVYPKIRHQRKDGNGFYVNVYARKTGHRPKSGIIATTVDITESLAKETQLIQASKMSTLGEMASGVAHEINQPLTALQIGTDFIINVANKWRTSKSGSGGIPQWFPSLVMVSELMREQIDRAVQIINHLREFGRKVEIKREKVYINKPIEAVFTLLGQQLKLRDIEVVLELDEDLPPIMSDVNRLEQVLIDLIVNARDAIEERQEQSPGGRVKNILTVKSFQENGRVIVTISDTGVGIPEGIKDKIFEPFFTTKEVGKGTGLGLSISYSIVKDYDGTIEAESEIGKGATFKIAFPACIEGKNGG